VQFCGARSFPLSVDSKIVEMAHIAHFAHFLNTGLQRNDDDAHSGQTVFVVMATHALYEGSTWERRGASR
jgi:hypothetical protein